jgi:hypothetical protein
MFLNYSLYYEYDTTAYSIISHWGHKLCRRLLSCGEDRRAAEIDKILVRIFEGSFFGFIWLDLVNVDFGIVFSG